MGADMVCATMFETAPPWPPCAPKLAPPSPAMTRPTPVSGSPGRKGEAHELRGQAGGAGPEPGDRAARAAVADDARAAAARRHRQQAGHRPLIGRLVDERGDGPTIAARQARPADSGLQMQVAREVVVRGVRAAVGDRAAVAADAARGAAAKARRVIERIADPADQRVERGVPARDAAAVAAGDCCPGRRCRHSGPRRRRGSHRQVCYLAIRTARWRTIGPG